MFKYIRRKFGEASFIHVDSFDNAEKDDRVKDSSAKVQGSPREETQKVSGDKGTS